MSSPAPEHPQADEPYCSTTQAAKLLGVSLGTVQQMVEDGVLEAWKTSGGHRRILRESVLAHISRRGALPHSAKGDNTLHVLIAEDEPLQQELYRRTLGKWQLPVHIEIVGSGIDGLVAVGRQVPDILIVDLILPGVDGFQMVRTLHANTALTQMDIIVVSALEPEDIRARGGLPEDVTYYRKPIPFHELRGYFQAKVTERLKSRRAAPAF